MRRGIYAIRADAMLELIQLVLVYDNPVRTRGIADAHDAIHTRPILQSQE